MRPKPMQQEGMAVRSPICTVLGHVDHGKSSILDMIRSTSIAKSEAGNITQAIGASIIPIDTIRKVCGPLFESLKGSSLPGLLFIDTPGHAAFTSLRKRGGSIADIAILVVDINEGFKPQTFEAVEILKGSKTPFVVAANKLDSIGGWAPAGGLLIQKLAKQPKNVVESIEKKLYSIVGSLGELGINSERFDRVYDYTKQIAIIPTSARTGDGIPELLMVITGLAQKYLEECLKCDKCGEAKGTILEVKDVKGLGKTIDLIIYDGCLKVGDLIVIGGVNEPIVTRVKALLEPAPLSEMRDKKTKFTHVRSVVAASGVKIAAPDLDGAVAGMPLVSSSQQNVAAVKASVMNEVGDILIDRDSLGIIVKADSLGSIEALVSLLKGKGIKIRRASIGNITKSDLADAQSNYESDPLLCAVLGFNVSSEFSETGTVKVITGDVIYSLIDGYEKWVEDEKRKMEEKELQGVTRPCKATVMKGYVFRQSNPAVFGVDVEAGTLASGVRMMRKDGKELGQVRAIQKDQKTVDRASRNEQVAVSMDNVTIGRQVNEGDVLYSYVSEDEFRLLKEKKRLLGNEDILLLKEIAEIKRKSNPVWGV